MKVTPMTIPEELRETITMMSAEGADPEAMIARMRQEGLPKIHSIKLLSEIAHMPLQEAKAKVHFSPVWQDRRKNDEALHDVAFRFAQELAREQSPPQSSRVLHLKTSA